MCIFNEQSIWFLQNINWRLKFAISPRSRRDAQVQGIFTYIWHILFSRIRSVKWGGTMMIRKYACLFKWFQLIRSNAMLIRLSDSRAGQQHEMESLEITWINERITLYLSSHHRIIKISISISDISGNALHNPKRLVPFVLQNLYISLCILI